MYTFSIELIPERRGKAVPERDRQIVDNLIAQALEIQCRFELAEATAFLLEEMLNTQSGSAKSIEDTYEGNAFVRLRFQLFRLLIVDLCAAVLDNTRKVASIRRLVQGLMKADGAAIDSLKVYYADPACVRTSIEAPDMDPGAVVDLKARLLEQSLEESKQSIEAQWKAIESSSILDGDAASRIKWARDKAIAHYEKTATNSLVALHDTPPAGSGNLTFGEPIEFLRLVKPFVYEVIGLITSTSWDEGPGQFFAQAFWDRFKNGHTDLSPLDGGI